VAEVGIRLPVAGRSRPQVTDYSRKRLATDVVSPSAVNGCSVAACYIRLLCGAGAGPGLSRERAHSG